MYRIGSHLFVIYDTKPDIHIAAVSPEYEFGYFFNFPVANGVTRHSVRFLGHNKVVSGNKLSKLLKKLEEKHKCQILHFESDDELDYFRQAFMIRKGKDDGKLKAIKKANKILSMQNDLMKKALKSKLRSPNINGNQ